MGIGASIDHPTRPDGIYYRSRHDPSRFGLALYERTKPILELVGQNDFLDAEEGERVSATILDCYQYGQRLSWRGVRKLSVQSSTSPPDISLSESRRGIFSLELLDQIDKQGCETKTLIGNPFISKSRSEKSYCSPAYD